MMNTVTPALTFLVGLKLFSSRHSGLLKVEGAMMRLAKLILISVVAVLPATAYAQTQVAPQVSSEAVEAPRASRIGNPNSPRNILRRALIQAAKSQSAQSGPLLPKSDQLAVATINAR
jgi:hypothetical protein